MAQDLVVTVLARDEPGIVEQLARIIAQQGGNWVDSSMARLSGEFAGILRITVPDDTLPALEVALKALEAQGIACTIRRTIASGPDEDMADAGRQVSLSLTGLDHTGIVLEVTRTLAARGVNVVAFNSSVTPGSMQGEPVFHASARLVLPPDVTLESVQEALEQIAQDIMVDLEVKGQD